jgi:hypothetical protein
VEKLPFVATIAEAVELPLLQAKEDLHTLRMRLQEGAQTIIQRFERGLELLL